MNINHFSEAVYSLKTVRDCLRFAVSRFNQAQLFFGHGSDDAYDEAAYLLLHALKLPLDKLEPFLDAKLTPQEIEALLALIERRCSERLPAAYLTNEAYLGDYRFYVDERVIVPRSFIGELLRGPLFCGDAALMASPDEPDAWLDQLDVLEDPAVRAAVIATGRERASRYTWRSAGQALLGLLIDAAQR